VRARQADRRCRGECAHTAWRAGSSAEKRPGGVCGADASRPHARTSRRGRGTAAHDGCAAATRGGVRACDVAPTRSRPWPMAGAPVSLHDSPKIPNKLQNP
jgi:hypothetical protein